MQSKYSLIKKVILFVIIILGSAGNINAQHEFEGRYIQETDPLVLEKLEVWQDIKFGLMMHWGPYSQWGIVESWSLCSEDEGWTQRKMDDYVEYRKEYEDLQTTFNPVKFDPERWALAAKNAGMRYVVFTTKHHDGFSMFDSKYTGYSIGGEKTPFSSHPKSNITKEIFSAFRDQGLWSGVYFSKPDWHSDYYWWRYFATPDRNVNYDPDLYPERWENFVQFTHNQILELMTDYGDIDILWLDGGWVQKRTHEDIIRSYHDKIMSAGSGFIKSRTVNQDIRMDELVEKAREKQPGLIVVDRAVQGKNQNYLTPENQVPDQMLPYPWESCIIAGGSWSWIPDAKYMTPRQLTHLLVDIVSKGGNLLLNIAPGPDGSWDDGAYEMLEGIGRWMDVNSEAIYETRALAPYKEGKVCLTSHKDNSSVYMIYLAGEGEEQPPSTIWLSSLSPLPNATITMLGDGRNLKWERSGEGVLVHIPARLQRNPPCRDAWTLKVSAVQQ
jgi:alpha-L-fucosidase